ncbi:response regulator transcription factor [Naumannella halotolerans]
MVREVEDRETLAQLHLDGPLSSLIASNHFADTLSVRLGKARLVAEQVLQDPEADIETLRRSLGDLVTASRMVQTELVELQLQITEGPSRRYASLTDREKAVAIELADEASNAEIAARLVVSTETVKSHIASIRRKYEMSDRSAIGQEIRQHLNHSRRRSDSEH